MSKPSQDSRTQNADTSDVKPSDGFDNLPELAIEIGNPPDEDIHGWLFKEALRLRKQGVPSARCYEEMLGASETQWAPRREIPAREIEGAVHDAYHLDLTRVLYTMESIEFSYDPVKGWPDHAPLPLEEMDEPLTRQIIAGCGMKRVEDLPAPAETDSQGVISHLFSPGDLLCCGMASNLAVIEAAVDWGRRLSRMQLIVPNAMRGQWAKNKSGKWSKRCRANVGDRRYLVVEMDKKCLSKDDQVGVLWHLGQTLPLRLIVDSGNKSLHGWFECHDVHYADIREWFRGAMVLGADHVTWKPEQYVRMPGGTRYNEAGHEVARQNVLYFNPLSNQ